MKSAGSAVCLGNFHDIMEERTIDVKGRLIMLQSLLSDTVQLAPNDQVLILNSAADPFVLKIGQEKSYSKSTQKTGIDRLITLAEDNIAVLQSTLDHIPVESRSIFRHVPFHEYTLHNEAATMDVAVMNMLYQPANAWMMYGLQLAGYALKPGGRLYVEGAKDRGVLSMAKRMQVYFSNVETLEISKGRRVLCSQKIESRSRFEAEYETRQSQGAGTHKEHPYVGAGQSDTLNLLFPVFAGGKLDEGTGLLLEALEVRQTDEALDLGCGAGFLGIHVARRASKGHVTMVDASLAAVAVARRMVEQSGLTNIEVEPSDGAKAVLSRRFTLVVTNPPFHLGGVQTTEVAERFIREAAKVLHPSGRFYLVANRFLKYEPALRTHFKTVEEVDGNARYKVLRGVGVQRV